MDVTLTKSTGISVNLEELLALKPCLFSRAVPTKLSHQQGVYASKFKGRGMEFQEVRHYQDGDDIRHMDWRITARTGKPHVKLYHQERERPIFIVCDFNPSMYFGTKVALKSVIGARLAALLAISFTHLGDKIGGLFFSSIDTKIFKPKTNALLPFLHHLSEFTKHFHQSETKPLTEIITTLSRIVPRSSTVFFISDFNHLDESSVHQLTHLAQQTKLVTCLIADSVEQQPPKPNVYAITDGKHKQLLNLTDKTTRQNYHQLYQQKVRRLKSSVTANHLFEISCVADLEKIVHEIGLQLSLGSCR